MLEIERKYLGVDFDCLRSRLRELGAACAGACLETNIILDTDIHTLFAKGELLRLRIRECPHKKDYLLTFKAPVEAAESQDKIREELETIVADGENAIKIFARLGYAQAAVYEKVREEWALHIDNNGNEINCQVDLDEVEFGRFCELEAPAWAMETVAKKLGLDKHERSRLTYHELHEKWLGEHNLPFTPDIVFNRKKLTAIRNRLGLPK